MEGAKSDMRAPILTAKGGPGTPERPGGPTESLSPCSSGVSSTREGDASGNWSSSGSSGSKTPPLESRSPGFEEEMPPLPAAQPRIAEAEKVAPASEAVREVRRVGPDLEDDCHVNAEAAAVAAAMASRLQQREEAADGRVYWEGFIVNMPIFCGYASLFGLQHEVKTRFGIQDSSSPMSIEFGVACSFLYIFNLIFRFSHNIVFGFMGPFGRTLIAMMCMILSMLILAVPICILEDYRLMWVYLAYAFGGVAVGTFEGNLLACLTPLGHRTKHVTITAIPVGVTTVLVGGFLIMGPPFYVPVTGLYLGVAMAVVLGMVTFVLRIPRCKLPASEQPNLSRFIMEAKAWRQWLPQMWHYPLATAVDMFTLSAFSPGVALYIWNQKTIAITPDFVMPTHTFFAIYNTANMIGGLIGRILSYRMRPRHPLFYTAFNIIGASMLLLKIPMLAPLSTLLVMVGDGLVYGSIARHIDTHVPKEFNLIAISFWLFVGDFGSVIGSNLISYITAWVMAA
eukprot:TRINITY_DN1455_c0_g1_i1.p1 TRINITY_DN1455_c0_g1~~TRINITY_DN1455_c0_g1_i1.p1  ORF type:complete len:547 (-),score=117.03 TRINITY_DN1455_c0_g1_i1:316-1848(-)